MSTEQNTHKSTDKLGGISETLLITLWARAVDTKREDRIINDPVATEMIEQIHYDFSVFENAKMSQTGCCIRASVMDKQAQTFIDQNPDAVVIQLGAGLDTRYQRLNCPDITHWYDLDLPEAIDIRRQLCPDLPKNTLLPLSMLDESWIDTVLAHNKPVLMISEGVLMYFEETDVKDFFAMICRRFERATLLFDMLTYVAKGNAKRHDAIGKTKNKAELKWSLLNSKDMEKWHDNLHVTEELYMSDFHAERIPLWLRLICKIPWIYKRFNQRMLRIEIDKVTTEGERKDE